MTDKPQPQPRRSYFIWMLIGLIALVGIGLIAFLAGQFFQGAGLGAAAATPTPTPLPPPVVTIQGIQAQAELTTVKYTAIAEVYRENVPDGWLDGFLGTQERLLLLVYGDVRAGFDLEKLKPEDIWTDGKRVRLVLPAPEILNSSVNFERTHIVYYENNLIFDDNNPNLQGEALAQAKDALEEAALTAGVLDQANQYGKVYYENFLYSLGFTDVEVVVDAQIFEE